MRCGYAIFSPEHHDERWISVRADFIRYEESVLTSFTLLSERSHSMFQHLAFFSLLVGFGFLLGVISGTVVEILI